MRALVCDASGLIGNRMIERLLAFKHDVVGFAPGKHAKADPGEAQLMAWPKAAGKLAEALQGIDQLFVPNLVDDLPASELKQIKALLEAAAKVGVKRVVVLSSIEVYDLAKLGGRTLLESDAQIDPAQASPKGKTALELESYVRGLPGQIERIVLRAPLVLSADHKPLAETFFKGLLKDDAQLHYGDRVQPIDADDLADLMVSAGRAPSAAGHAINVAGPIAILTADASAEARRLLGVMRDTENSEVRVRPEYEFASPLISTDRALTLLPKHAIKRVWVSLAEIAQEIVHRQRAEGELPEIMYKTSYAKMAVERREKPLKGKLAVVTGATDGIGRATALMFSRLGAKVVAVGRNKEAGAALLEEMKGRKVYTNGKFMAADLTSQKEVRALAAKIAKQHDAIDYLIHNAGAAYGSRTETPDGLEATFALNVMAPFLLTQELATPLQAADHARVVTLSSEAHQEAELMLEDLQSTDGYEPMEVYSRAKLCGLMITRCLAEQLKDTGIAAHAIHPGEVRTDIALKNGMESDEDKNLGPQAKQRLNTQRDRQRMQMISPEEAAAYVVNLAVSPEYNGENGLYMDKGDKGQASETAQDSKQAWLLWDKCAEFAGLVDA